MMRASPGKEEGEEGDRQKIYAQIDRGIFIQIDFHGLFKIFLLSPGDTQKADITLLIETLHDIVDAADRIHHGKIQG